MIKATIQVDVEYFLSSDQSYQEKIISGDPLSLRQCTAAFKASGEWIKAYNREPGLECEATYVLHMEQRLRKDRRSYDFFEVVDIDILPWP